MAVELAVVDYGIGNLRSAQKALEHLGADASLTSDADAVRAADAVVLPGVGAFGACMRALETSGLAAATRDAASDGRPFLAICVGMQMLFEGSDESPEIAGLAVLPGRVERLPGHMTLPQMGWNTLDRSSGAAMLAGLPDPVWMYFVHTYAVLQCEPGIVAATSCYGTDFVAAIESGPVWATQFHPEKSSDAGLALLMNFVKACSR